MSKDVIVKIKAAEAEADAIRAAGAEQAKEKLRLAEESGRQLCERAEEEATRENREKLRLTAEKAEELLVRSRKDAEKETALLREKSADRMADAVRMIIGGLFEKCQ